MENAKPGYHGMVSGPYGGLSISVSPKSVRRSLLIFDALLKECQARRYPVSATEQYPHETRVVVNQVTFTLEISEAKTRIKHVLTPEENRKVAENRFSVERWHDEPSGRLRLRVRLANWLDQKWEDRKVQQLESCLDQVFEWIEKAAQSHVDMQKRRAEEERTRYELEQRRREEERKVQQLKDEAARWREARLLREYLEAARVAIGETGAIEPGSPADTWLTWASSVVEAMDPISETSLRDGQEEDEDDED